MIRRYLGKYKSFKCIADKCPATCCSGWAVEIDEASLESYKKDRSYYKSRVDWHESCFIGRDNGDCAFLRPDGFCQLIIDKGEAALCRTCDLYPRHIEEFPDVREYSLSVSCPVVAEEILSLDDRIKVETTSNDECDADDYEDFDPELYDTLLSCRENVFAIINETRLSFDEKCFAITEYMRNIQDGIDGIDDTDKSFSISDHASQDQINEFQHIYNSRDLFLLFYELEPLQEAFRKELEDKDNLLFGFNPFISQDALRSFLEAHPHWQSQCENLLTYFIFTYMCGAVYDEYVYSMTAQAVYSTYMVRLLWIAEFLNKKAPLTITEQARVLYLYSRELEHSNENMILLEKLLEDNF